MYTQLNDLELAERFAELADKFLELIKTHDLDTVEVAFARGYVKAEVPTCGTVACHGGWAALLFAEELPLPTKYKSSLGYDIYSFFSGAEALANFLGFSDDDALRYWADCNSTIWGNDLGLMMFSAHGHLAFDKADGESTSLLDIVAKYLQVSTNLLNRHLSGVPQ